jgi:hypothetical protein
MLFHAGAARSPLLRASAFFPNSLTASPTAPNGTSEQSRYRHDSGYRGRCAGSLSTARRNPAARQAAAVRRHREAGHSFWVAGGRSAPAGSRPNRRSWAVRASGVTVFPAQAPRSPRSQKPPRKSLSNARPRSREFRIGPNAPMTEGFRTGNRNRLGPARRRGIHRPSPELMAPPHVEVGGR